MPTSDASEDEGRPDASVDLAAAALDLARGFADGGTLWCWAPGATRHARHVAVEFVHPVVTGTRALPAVALVESDPTEELRTMSRSGDALLVIAGAGAPVASLARRAEAWGVTTLWMGAGPPPPDGSVRVDHLLWLTDDAAAWHDGRLVLGYHLLWELTHVCFEHPGLLTDEAAATTSGDMAGGAPVCTTCSDEGWLAEVQDSAAGDATVRSPRGLETVNTLLVGPVGRGDLVLVHAGTAISVVDP